jgi:hypothetical protein
MENMRAHANWSLCKFAYEAYLSGGSSLYPAKKTLQRYSPIFHRSKGDVTLVNIGLVVMTYCEKK